MTQEEQDEFEASAKKLGIWFLKSDTQSPDKPDEVPAFFVETKRLDDLFLGLKLDAKLSVRTKPYNGGILTCLY